MKAPIIVALIVFVAVSVSTLAEEDEASIQKEAEASQGQPTKEARVKEAEAQLKEKQKLFDELAEELEEARARYFEARRELSSRSRSLYDTRIEQLSDPHLETVAELESWVLADRALLDIANAINVEDIVTPAEDYLKSMFVNVSQPFVSFSEQDLGVTLELTSENQVLVTSIDPEARFHVSNLKPNDVITEVNGQLAVDEIDDPVATMKYFLYPYAKVVKGFPPLVLKVNRDNKNVDVEIHNDDEALQTQTLKNFQVKTPTLHFSNKSRAFTVHYNLPPPVFILEVEDELGRYFDVDFGVLVLQAPEDSEFKAGDILIKIEDTSIRAIDHVMKAFKNSDNDVITTIVKRKGKNVEIEMERSSVIFRNAEEQMIH